MDRMREDRGRSHRVVRAFAFLDLCGFTDFVDTEGDDAAVGELRLLRSTVRDLAPVCGVRVDKWLGDGVMLVSVEAVLVVDAVCAIVDRVGAHGQLPVRAGLATGTVILLEGDDYVGRTVNLAARLCDLAQPGEILAALDGLPLPDDVRAVDLTTIQVRGLREPVPVGRLVMSPPEDTHGLNVERVGEEVDGRDRREPVPVVDEQPGVAGQ
jgi:class 3 adenylate cyclase